MEIEVKDPNPPVLIILQCHDNDLGSLNVSNIDSSEWQIRRTGSITNGHLLFVMGALIL